MFLSAAPGAPPDDPVRGFGPCSCPPRMLQSGASFCRILSVASDDPVRGPGFPPGRSSPGGCAVLHSAPDAPIRGVFLMFSLRCLGRSSPWHRVLPRTIQSGGLGRAPLRPGCSNPGRLFVVFSPLPWTLQSVAPGSPPDDPVRGLVPCFFPPRMLQSGASCYRILSVASDAPVRGTWFTPGRSSPGASAVLHSAPDAPIRGVFLWYSLCCLGHSSPWHRVHPPTIPSGGSGRTPLRPGCSNPGRHVSYSLCCLRLGNPTAHALASWLCALWGRHEGARGGRLLPGCGASEVGRSPSPDHLSFRACGRGPLPAGRGCGVRALGPGCPWHLIPCCGSSCVVRASRVRGTRWPLWLGTCPCAVVVAGGVPLWRASWPRVGAPLLVRSGRSRCFGRLSRRRGAFPQPGGCRPRLYWVAARGTWRPAENRAHCACRWPLPRQGRLARSASYSFGAPRWGCPWRVPPASVLGCVCCGGSACVDPVTDASGFPYRPSFDAGLGQCTGAVSCGRRHRPFRVGGRHTRIPRVCVCLLFLAGSGGPASRARFGAPHLSSGRSWCALCLFGPLQAGVAPFVVVVGVFFFPFPLPPRCCAPVVSCFACFPATGASGLGVLLPPPLFFPLPPPPCAPLSPAFRVFRPRVPWASSSYCPPPSPPPGLFCFFLFFAPPPCCLWRFLFSGCLGPLRPPLPFFLLFFFPSFFFCRLCAAGRVCASFAVGCARVCLGGAVPVVALCALAGVVWCWLLGLAVLCCLPVGLAVVLRWCCPCLAAWLVALWLGVVCLGVPLPCVVFCCAVLSCGGVLSGSAICLRRCLCLLFVSCRCVSAVCVLGCRAVCSLSSPPCAVLCCAVLVPFRCAVRVVCAVPGGWCCWFPVSLPFVGGLLVALVARRCRLVVCVGFGSRVWSGCPSASSLWSPATLCCVLWRCAAVWFCAVVPCFLFFCFSPCRWHWFPVVPCWFWAPGRFWVVSVSVLCLCGAVLVCLRRCSLFRALLPSRGWLVFCVVACCVCVFAVGPGCPLLSPDGSSWLLVSCLAGVLWCVPGCCAAPWCCALCRLALRCCALCCFVLLRLVLPRAVLCPGALSVVLGVCLLAPCFVLSPRAVCVLLWCVAAWCCSPLCFVPCAPWGVVLCVSCCTYLKNRCKIS